MPPPSLDGAGGRRLRLNVPQWLQSPKMRVPTELWGFRPKGKQQTKLNQGSDLARCSEKKSGIKPFNRLTLQYSRMWDQEMAWFDLNVKTMGGNPRVGRMRALGAIRLTRGCIGRKTRRLGGFRKRSRRGKNGVSDGT